MEYIQCTHCGKKYAVTDQIKEAQGQFSTCQACQEKFLIVVHNTESDTGKKEVITTGGWDPSLVVVEDDEQQDGEQNNVDEQVIDDDFDDQGTQVLLALQAARRKKLILYISIAVGVCVILAGVWFFLSQEDDASNMQSHIKKQTQVAQKIPQELDSSNMACRQEAAKQWLLDDKAMHSNYTADEFVRLLKASEKQSDQVRQTCKQQTIIQDIITAATANTKPDWFKAEIESIQSRRK